MKLARLSALLCAAALALAPAAQAKDWKKVVIATEGAYMPFNGISPDGKVIGYEVDLAADICGRAKLTCEFLPTAWDGIIPGLNAGKYDAIMSGMSITEKRLEVVAFTRNYTQSPSTFMVMKTGPLAGLAGGERLNAGDAAASEAAVKAIAAQLKGKIVGVQTGTIQADLLNTYFKGLIEVRTYKTTEEHDLDLSAGRIDAAFASTSYFVSTLKKPGGDQMRFAGPLWVGGMLGQGAGIAMRKSDADLKALLNTALQEALADGSVRKLSLKWFGIDISPAS